MLPHAFAAALNNATANLTSAAEAQCTPSTFLVPLFGGEPNGGLDGTNIASYAGKSDTAHLVLGIFVIIMVFSWSLFVLDYIRIRVAAAISGGIQCCMGLYLFVSPQNIVHCVLLRTVVCYVHCDHPALPRCSDILCCSLVACCAAIVTDMGVHSVTSFRPPCTLLICHLRPTTTTTHSHCRYATRRRNCRAATVPRVLHT